MGCMLVELVRKQVCKLVQVHKQVCKLGRRLVCKLAQVRKAEALAGKVEGRQLAARKMTLEG